MPCDVPQGSCSCADDSQAHIFFGGVALNAIKILKKALWWWAVVLGIYSEVLILASYNTDEKRKMLYSVLRVEGVKMVIAFCIALYVFVYLISKKMNNWS